MSRFFRLILAVTACGVLGLGGAGCALRASTDFGPGEGPPHQSVSAGVGPFPSVLSSDRSNGGNPADAPGAVSGPGSVGTESGGWR